MLGRGVFVFQNESRRGGTPNDDGGGAQGDDCSNEGAAGEKQIARSCAGFCATRLTSFAIRILSPLPARGHNSAENISAQG